MKHIRYILFVVLFQCCASLLLSQIDTSVLIQEIELVSEKERLTNYGGNFDVIYDGQNPNQQTQDLGQIISQQSGVFIKSYGSNSLATSSIRGGSSGHTLVLWNGIPLASPTLGLLDFALMSGTHTDQVGIHKGGNSALWGSGAIGGVISLQSNPEEERPRASGFFRIGSFGLLDGGASINYKQKKVMGSTRFSVRHADNNFKFRPAPGLNYKELSNARFLNKSLSQDLLIKIGSKSKLKAHCWWSNSYKGIPPTTTQNYNEAYQFDTANRLMFDWTRIGAKNKIQAKVAVLAEDQKYFNQLIDLESENTFVTTIAELNYTKDLGEKNQVLAGTTFTSTEAKTFGFPSSIEQNRLGIWVSHRLKLDVLKLQSSLRAESIDGEWIPLTPSVGAELTVIKQVLLKGKVSRNYRLPTLNDLYWIPGGNSELLPESGWSQELGITKEFKIFDESQISITGYNRNIKNWILWSPTESQAFWQAQNLTEVWSRGLEVESQQKLSFKKWEVGLNTYYNFVKSTNEIALTIPLIKKGEQLIYTPKHQLTNVLSLTKNKIHFSLNHIYRSESKGVNEDIDGYHLVNLDLGYTYDYVAFDVEIYSSINNVLGAEYYIIERRPMPLANYSIGIKINLK